jgi:quercetin dioxygenase-like cupin family protein
MSTLKATTMWNTGMYAQRTALLAVATIIFAPALYPTRANAQRGGDPRDLQHAQQAQAAREGGQEGSQKANVTPLLSKPLPDFPGKEVMITVTYAPGASAPPHKHNAHGFIYVLEGSIVMGVQGGKPVTLTPGQTFYEGPTDIHTIGRTRARRSPRNFWCSCSRTKMLLS